MQQKKNNAFENCCKTKQEQKLTNTEGKCCKYKSTRNSKTSVRETTNRLHNSSAPCQRGGADSLDAQMKMKYRNMCLINQGLEQSV